MTTPFTDSEIGRLRGQWGDFDSIFAVAPGTVIARRCSQEVNRRLRDHGIEVAERDASKFGQGRGGSRCIARLMLRDLLS